MSSNRPPQLHLTLPSTSTSFKRSFEEFGFDLESPGGSGAEASGSGGNLSLSGGANEGNERNKRPRSSSNLSRSGESSGTSSHSEDSIADSSGGTTVSSNDSELDSISALSATRPSVLSSSTEVTTGSSLNPPRLPTPDIEDVEMPHYPIEDSPSLPTSPIPSIPTTSYTDQDESYRISLERFNAFDSQISALRQSRSPRNRSPTPPPTLPPLTIPPLVEELDHAQTNTTSFLLPHVEPSPSLPSFYNSVRAQPEHHAGNMNHASVRSPSSDRSAVDMRRNSASSSSLSVRRGDVLRRNHLQLPPFSRASTNHSLRSRTTRESSPSSIVTAEDFWPYLVTDAELDGENSDDNRHPQNNPMTSLDLDSFLRSASPLFPSPGESRIYSYPERSSSIPPVSRSRNESDDTAERSSLGFDVRRMLTNAFGPDSSIDDTLHFPLSETSASLTNSARPPAARTSPAAHGDERRRMLNREFDVDVIVADLTDMRRSTQSDRRHIIRSRGSDGPFENDASDERRQQLGRGSVPGQAVTQSGSQARAERNAREDLAPRHLEDVLSHFSLPRDGRDGRDSVVRDSVATHRDTSNSDHFRRASNSEHPSLPRIGNLDLDLFPELHGHHDSSRRQRLGGSSTDATSQFAERLVLDSIERRFSPPNAFPPEPFFDSRTPHTTRFPSPSPPPPSFASSSYVANSLGEFGPRRPYQARVGSSNSLVSENAAEFRRRNARRQLSQLSSDDSDDRDYRLLAHLPLGDSPDSATDESDDTWFRDYFASQSSLRLDRASSIGQGNNPVTSSRRRWSRNDSTGGHSIFSFADYFERPIGHPISPWPLDIWNERVNNVRRESNHADTSHSAYPSSRPPPIRGLPSESHPPLQSSARHVHDPIEISASNRAAVISAVPSNPRRGREAILNPFSPAERLRSILRDRDMEPTLFEPAIPSSMDWTSTAPPRDLPSPPPMPTRETESVPQRAPGGPRSRPDRGGQPPSHTSYDLNAFHPGPFRASVQRYNESERTQHSTRFNQRDIPPTSTLPPRRTVPPSLPPLRFEGDDEWSPAPSSQEGRVFSEPMTGPSPSLRSDVADRPAAGLRLHHSGRDNLYALLDERPRIRPPQVTSHQNASQAQSPSRPPDSASQYLHRTENRNSARTRQDTHALLSRQARLEASRIGTGGPPSTNNSRGFSHAIEVLRADGLSPRTRQQLINTFQRERSLEQRRASLWGDLEGDHDGHRPIPSSSILDLRRRRMNRPTPTAEDTAATNHSDPQSVGQSISARSSSHSPVRDDLSRRERLAMAREQSERFAARSARFRGPRHRMQMREADSLFSDVPRIEFGNRPVFRRGRNPGDYMRDEDFDSSYENLLSIASALGDARPRATPDHVIASLETSFYKDLATAESDDRCPICLEDYKSLDPILKLSDCPHWLHKNCLEQWLHGASTCPVCRKSVKGSGERDEAGPSGIGGIWRRDDDDDDEHLSLGNGLWSRFSLPIPPPWR